MSTTLLVLSHCGGGYLNEILSAANSLNLKVFILSSRPGRDSSLNNYLAKTIESESIQNESLSLSDVESALRKLEERGCHVSACITVWEGYRWLMAQANLHLGAQDMTPHQVELIQDKWAWRDLLRAQGMSKTPSFEAHATDLSVPLPVSEMDNAQTEWFVKPSSGAGSFGTKRWRGETPLEISESWIRSLDTDGMYRELMLLNGQLKCKILFETELTGLEVSFECLVDSDEIHIAAIHEKIPTQEINGTVLEPGCISPPISLSADELNDAQNWFRDVMRALKINRGCYHVEAFKTPHGWEVVDINPRVGGALIFESTLRLSGVNLIREWIAQLISSKRESSSEHTFSGYTFFRVFFAMPDRWVEDVKLVENSHLIPPSRVVIQALKQKKTPASIREIFAGQCLWELLKPPTREFISESAKVMEVVYCEA